MKNITLSVDEETYRHAKIVAAQQDQSVSALVRGFLRSLNALVGSSQSGRKERRPRRPLSAEALLRRWNRLTPIDADDLRVEIDAVLDSSL